MGRALKDLGTRGEKIARKFLRREGYRIRALNYSSQYGEIDIIGQDGETIAFVEVRTQSSNEFGDPLGGLSYKKKVHFTKAAKDYLYRYGLMDRDHRFDFVSIVFDEKGIPKIELIKDAFPPTR